jgi:hypothetical protein
MSPSRTGMTVLSRSEFTITCTPFILGVYCSSVLDRGGSEKLTTQRGKCLSHSSRFAKIGALSLNSASALAKAFRHSSKVKRLADWQAFVVTYMAVRIPAWRDVLGKQARTAQHQRTTSEFDSAASSLPSSRTCDSGQARCGVSLIATSTLTLAGIASDLAYGNKRKVPHFMRLLGRGLPPRPLSDPESVQIRPQHRQCCTA